MTLLELILVVLALVMGVRLGMWIANKQADARAEVQSLSARIDIEAMRLMVLRAAKAMDTLGNAEARVWVSAVKAMVPEKCCDIIDEAIQMRGAAGISQWFPLADMWHAQRTLRLADGPDEVHRNAIAKLELARHMLRTTEVEMPVTRGC